MQIRKISNCLVFFDYMDAGPGRDVDVFEEARVDAKEGIRRRIHWILVQCIHFDVLKIFP